MIINWRIAMKKLKLKDNIWWIGATDHKLRVFDIIMHTEFGTSYNSYLVKGSEKTAVVETVKHTFTDDYLKRLQEEIDVTTIDYIIVNHTEPDHAGTVGALLDIAPQAVVIGSGPAIRFLGMIANRPFESIEVNEGDEISLGDKTLHFIHAPFLHWPDSIYTYVKEDKVLFTCDSFGAHYATDDILLSKVENRDDYHSALRYYFNMIFGPFKRYMLDAIKKIEPLEIDMICNGHGPVLDENPMEIVRICKEWSTEPAREGKRVVIPYVSAYGYTKQIAETIRATIEAEGIEVQMFDLVYDSEASVLNAIGESDGVLFGSPTINGDALLPIMKLLLQMSPLVHNHMLTGAFGSFGWSGEAVDNLTRRLVELRTRVVPGLKVNFKPSGDELEQAKVFAKDFADLVNEKAEYIAAAVETGDNQEDEYFIYDGTVKLWRCVVCGEVFEGERPPAICPACGATIDQFEEYIEDVITYQSEAQEQVVIVGNGAAGVTAAEAARARNANAKITIVDREDQLLYYKPMLSEYLADNSKLSDIYLHDAEWYAEKGFDLKLGVEAASIDADNGRLLLTNGEALDYTKLILAAGSKSFVPPIMNADYEGVFTLRNMGDADAIKAYASGKSKAVVVGGGLLGLEAADEMKAMGLEVTVVEIANRLLPRQIDEKGAAIFERAVADHGINLIKGCVVKEIIGHGKAEKVHLGSGRTLEADIVLVSAGVVADTALAKTAGVECNRGIVVNGKMETSVSGIYAAGDVAECNGINYAIWPEAIEQGKIAGANAVGDSIEYADFIPSNVFNGMNINVFSIGKVNVEDEDEESRSDLLLDDPETGVYKRILFKDHKMTGGIAIGDNKHSKRMIEGMKIGAKPQHMIKVLK